MMINPMHPIHTARPVDARWQWICELDRENRLPKDKYDDEWIRRGVALRRRTHACRNQSELERIKSDYRDIIAAEQLRVNAGKMERAIVEAHLLSGQSVEEVAAACNLAVETVIAYEKLFYQVLGRLGARLFILSKALSVDFFGRPPREEDTDVLLKLFAYQKGPLFLEIALRYFRDGIKLPPRLGDATTADLDELAMMLRMRAVVLATVLPHPKCRRALLWSDLAEEVADYAASRWKPAFVPIASPASVIASERLGLVDAVPATTGQGSSAVQPPRDESDPPPWWSAIQEAMQAA